MSHSNRSSELIEKSALVAQSVEFGKNGTNEKSVVCSSDLRYDQRTHYKKRERGRYRIGRVL